MDSTLWSSIVFTFFIVLVPHLIAAYFNNPPASKCDIESVSGRRNPQ